MNELFPIPQFGHLLTDCPERPGAYAILTDTRGKILVVLVRGRFHLPGGGIDAGEDPEIAVRREVKEETGYTVASLEFLGRRISFWKRIEGMSTNSVPIIWEQLRMSPRPK
ncbi:NUDIX domain-containing protein [Candidatus Uhrbacteria bacterium]|nr:NUDIX domain-containing protein [Candidatus Uhrbacteria bacterium]